MNSEQCSLILRPLSPFVHVIFLQKMFGIFGVLGILHFSCYCSLYDKIHFWEQGGKRSFYLCSCCLSSHPFFLFIKYIFFHTFEFSSSSPSFPWPQFLSDGIQWFFFPLNYFRHCVWGLNNRHTQFISGCCCLAVLWEATAAPELVTNRGRCKVRKFFASVTLCRSCILQNRC